jgi:hypothetical protein
VGGLVGNNYGDVNYYKATGDVNGTDISEILKTSTGVGGLIGNSSGDVTYSRSTGEVNGTNDVGGLVGEVEVGGTVANSTASGNVNGCGLSVGGLVGYNSGTVAASYATNTVSGGDDVGGLVGYNSNEVRDSYAVREVSGENNVGGLVGGNGGTVTDGYWDINTTSQTTSSGGTGLTTPEMTGASATGNMSGFDFTNTWENVTDGSPSASRSDGYPILRGLQPEPQVLIPVQFDLTELRTAEKIGGSTIQKGDEGNITVNVTNVGFGPGKDNVSLEIGSSVQNNTTVELDPGENRTVTFRNATGGLDTGPYPVSVSTDLSLVSDPLDVLNTKFNLDFENDSPYQNGSSFTGSEFRIENESGVVLNDGGAYSDSEEFELNLTVSKAGNETDVKEEVFNELVVNPRGAPPTEVIEGGNQQAEFDEAFDLIDVPQFRDGLYVRLLGSIEANATAGDYNVTFEMLEGEESIATDEQNIRINEPKGRNASFNLDFAENSPYQKGSDFSISNESAIVLNDTDEVVDEVEIRLNVTEAGNETDVKEEVFNELVVNPRGAPPTEVIEGGNQQAEFDEAFDLIDVPQFRDGLKVELAGEVGKNVSTGDYNITLTLLAEGVEVENGTIFEAGAGSIQASVAESGIGIDTTVLRETETTTFRIGNEPGDAEPLIDSFENPPRNIPEDEGGLDDSLMEDLDGDGDATDVSETVAVFGRLIRGEDLGVSDEQARRLDWSEESPETEVTASDMVALFGEQLRAD